jgi:hypothetical protein
MPQSSMFGTENLGLGKHFLMCGVRFFKDLLEMGLFLARIPTSMGVAPSVEMLLLPLRARALRSSLSGLIFYMVMKFSSFFYPRPFLFISMACKSFKNDETMLESSFLNSLLGTMCLEAG